MTENKYQYFKLKFASNKAHGDENNLSKLLIEILNLDTHRLKLITDNAYKTINNNHNVKDVINKIYLDEF